MKKLIIILSLSTSFLFAQENNLLDKMRNALKYKENYLFLLSKDSINTLQVVQYKKVIDTQSIIIKNNKTDIKELNLHLTKCKKRRDIYKWIAIGAGVVVGVMVITK